VTLEVFAHRVVGALECNCYVVGDPAARKAIVIDPGDDADELAEIVSGKGLEVTAIVATHAHFDHVLAARRLRELAGAPFVLHRDDLTLLDWLGLSARMWLGVEVGEPPEVDAYADDGGVLRAGAVELEVVHTPGHSPGSVSLLSPDAVFSGDTLFAGSIGRSDLPGGDGDTLLASIRARLLPLDDDLVVLPGHGPATTIERERRSNPFVGDRGGPWTSL
jgi:glyoxylase-like metal-dependent hydrolase (beta-lactamase superfamily II)